MRFWSSSETSPEAVDAIRKVQNRSDPLINEMLSAGILSARWNGWKWTFVAIIISPSLGVDYTERIRRNNRRQVLEFRLRINFDEFVNAAFCTQAELMFEQLHRSVEIMKKWHMATTDQDALHSILTQTFTMLTSN